MQKQVVRQKFEKEDFPAIFEGLTNHKTKENLLVSNLNVISEKLAEEIKKHLVENQVTISLSEIERTSRKLLQEIGREAIAKATQEQEMIFPRRSHV